jgi:hypothetical protein
MHPSKQFPTKNYRRIGMLNHLRFILVFTVFKVFISSAGLSQNIAGGFYYSLAIKSDGTLVGWKDTASSVIPSANTGFVAISSGESHFMGLKSDGSLLGGGRNIFSELNVPTPNSNFVSVAIGESHTVGLKSDGTIVCWGYGGYGECSVPAPNSDFVAVAAGRHHSIGLKSDGSVVCWGANFYGECNVPSPNTGFIAIAGLGYDGSMGLKSDGSVVCWGFNDYGACNVPPPNSEFVAIAGGKYHALGLKSDGSIVGWGYNSDGQSNAPTPNSGFIGIAGGGLHSIGFKSDGSVVCWGYNYGGQCDVPVPNLGFNKIPIAPVALAAGSKTSTSFAARWAPSVNATGYQLDVSTHADFSTCDLANNYYINGGSVTSCAIVGLTEGSVCYYRVRAVNGYGVSFKSAAIAVTVTPKLSQTVTFNSLSQVTYGDAPFTISATGGASGKPVSFTSSDNTVATCTGTNGSTINVLKAGSCIIYAYQPGSVSYEEAPVVSQVLTIKPKTLTANISIPSSKTYDGTNSVAINSSSLNGVINSDDVFLTGTLSYVDKNAGTGKTIVTTGISITGTKAGNYSLTPPILTADILKASLVLGITGQDKIYDGTTNATVITSITSGLLTGDLVTVSASNCRFNSKNAGTNKNIYADIAITGGADGGNYTCNASATGKANVTKATLNIGLSVQNKTYDGTTNATATAIIISGKVSGDVINVGASNYQFDSKDPGNNKSVSASIYASGTDISNYTFNTTAIGYANIARAFVKVDFWAKGKYYDGSRNGEVDAYITSGKIYNEEVNVTAYGTFDNKNVGYKKKETVYLALTGADAGNYICNSTVDTTSSIEVTMLTIGVTANDKTYNGTASATGTGIIKSGLVTGDDVSVSLTNGYFDDKNVGNRGALFTVYLSGADALNYYFNPPSYAMANIVKAPLTFTLTAQNKTYTGSTYAQVAVSTASGLMQGDAVTVNATGYFDNKNAGVGKKVTGIISLSGTNAGNYYAEPVFNYANIDKAVLLLKITSQDKVYDGTDAAVVNASIVTGVVNGDDVTVVASNGKFDSKNAGTGKLVTADISFAGADAGNYTWTPDGLTLANITRYLLTTEISCAPNKTSYRGVPVTITATYPFALNTQEGTPYISLNGAGVNLSEPMSSSDRITWTYMWTPPAEGNGTININAALQDIAGNFHQTVTGKTTLILDNTPNDVPTTETSSASLKVYPSVSENIFNIALSNCIYGKATVRIFNLSGVMVKEGQFFKPTFSAIFKMNMENAGSGAYIVEVIMDGLREVRKVIKEN